MVGVAEHFFEDDRGLVYVPDAGQALDVPEGADGEGPLISLQSVGGTVFLFVAEDKDVG